MISAKIFQTSLAALGFACVLGVAPALAQTVGGTMAPAAGLSASAPTAAAKLSKNLEFNALATAAAHCPDDTVVWSSLSKSHSFHLSTSKHFGKTKRGAYVCEKDALAAGFHQAKN